MAVSLTPAFRDAPRSTDVPEKGGRKISGASKLCFKLKMTLIYADFEQ